LQPGAVVARPHSAQIQLRNTHAAASRQRKPDRLLLQLLSGIDRLGGSRASHDSSTSSSSTTSSSSSSSSSSGDGLFASIDQSGPLRQGIINPNNKWYRAWWGLLIGAAAFTGIFVPWELGFGDLADMYSLSNVATWIDLILVALFMADIGGCCSPQVWGT